MGTDAKTMAWAMDTYMNTVGQLFGAGGEGRRDRQAGGVGGTYGREKATGQGVVHCITEWAEDNDVNLGGSTLLVQGFGNVGSHTAVLLSKLGASTVAVGDHTGYLYNPEGFNPHKLQDYVKKNRSIAGYPAGKPISARGVLPALRRTSSSRRPWRTRSAWRRRAGCRSALVAEGANGPCTPEGEKILLERGIHILPDVLANSGRRHGELLRAGAEQALGVMDARGGRLPAREGDEAGLPRGDRDGAQKKYAAPRRLCRGAAAARRGVWRARDLPRDALIRAPSGPPSGRDGGALDLGPDSARPLPWRARDLGRPAGDPERRALDGVLVLDAAEREKPCPGADPRPGFP